MFLMLIIKLVVPCHSAWCFVARHPIRDKCCAKEIFAYSCQKVLPDCQKHAVKNTQTMPVWRKLPIFRYMKW